MRWSSGAARERLRIIQKAQLKTADWRMSLRSVHGCAQITIAAYDRFTRQVITLVQRIQLYLFYPCHLRNPWSV
jgi:hypothetical protein